MMISNKSKCRTITHGVEAYSDPGVDLPELEPAPHFRILVIQSKWIRGIADQGRTRYGGLLDLKMQSCISFALGYNDFS